MMPRAIDLYCGLGGWTDGLLAEGWDVVGFDIEQHVYGDHRYPAQLVVQDALTLHGSQFKDAGLIVASPPCQEYSYMAMPWTRAKQIARALRGEDEFPAGYKGSRAIADLNALFDACFRIQREASQAAGKHVPMIVENVRGAQPWVGRAAWNFVSYYLWGDVPALMPMINRKTSYRKSPSESWNPDRPSYTKDKGWKEEAIKNTGGSWFNEAHNTTSDKGRNSDGRKTRGHPNQRNGHAHTKHLTNPGEHGRKFTIQQPGDKAIPRDPVAAASGASRKAASAMIAKIPFELSRHIAAVYRPADRDGNRVRHLIPDPCHLTSGA